MSIISLVDPSAISNMLLINSANGYGIISRRVGVCLNIVQSQESLAIIILMRKIWMRLLLVVMRYLLFIPVLLLHSLAMPCLPRKYSLMQVALGLRIMMM